MKTAEETKSFKNWLHCHMCTYEDIKHLCKPRTKSCVPIFPYDWQIKSRLLALDKVAHKDISEQDKNKIIKRQYDN